MNSHISRAPARASTSHWPCTVSGASDELTRPAAPVPRLATLALDHPQGFCDDPLALASALYKLEHATSRYPLPQTQQLVNASHMMIANPFRGGGAAKLFATHPPMADRIQRLEKMAVR